MSVYGGAPFLPLRWHCISCILRKRESVTRGPDGIITCWLPASEKLHKFPLPCSLIMTQLTYRRAGGVTRQHQRSRSSSLSSDSASEGDAQGYMARIRRSNSNTGRRRHGSEQPDLQRNIRPKATDSQPLTSSEGVRYPSTAEPQRTAPATVTYPSYPYRGIPPPPQLLTSQWPENLGSPDSSTPGFSAYDSAFRTLSPIEYTPTHSVSSGGRLSSHDGLAAYQTSARKRSDSGSTSFLDRALNHGK